MRINKAGIDLIKKFEGLRLKAYKDAVGILTIGYGHTGSDVDDGQEIDCEEADELLASDLENFETGVAELLKVNVTENQFSALVCFAYNIGLNAFSGSTMLKKINSNDLFGAAEQFERWNKAGGKVLNGLVKRREAERLLFLSETL